MPAIRTGINDLDKHSVVLHNSKSVFMPIGKAAGTSIRRSLTEDFEYRTKDEVARDFSQYRKVAVVRNPFDRLVSVYSFFTAPNTWAFYYFRDKVQDISFGSFGSFIREVYNRPDDISNCHYRSQYNLLSLDGGFLPDVVVKYENLQEIKKYLPIDTLQWADQTRSKHKHYTAFYTPELIEMVNQRFKKDLEYFDYEMEM